MAMKRDHDIKDRMVVVAKKRRNEYASLRRRLVKSIEEAYEGIAKKRKHDDDTFKTIVSGE
jgi:hypothetical protein